MLWFFYYNEGYDEYEKKNFSNAVDFYTEGIKVNCKDKELAAKLYCSRAEAQFCLGETVWFHITSVTHGGPPRLWKNNKFSQIHFPQWRVFSRDNSGRLKLADLTGNIHKAWLNMSYELNWVRWVLTSFRVSPLPSVEKAERPLHFGNCSAGPARISSSSTCFGRTLKWEPCQ